MGTCSSGQAWSFLTETVGPVSPGEAVAAVGLAYSMRTINTNSSSKLSSSSAGILESVEDGLVDWVLWSFFPCLYGVCLSSGYFNVPSWLHQVFWPFTLFGRWESSKQVMHCSVESFTLCISLRVIRCSSCLLNPIKSEKFSDILTFKVSSLV